LKELQGEFIAWVPPETLAFTFPKLAAEQNSKQHDVQVSIDQVKVEPNPPIWTVSVRLQYPSGALELESHQTWAMASNQLALKKGSQTRMPVGEDIAIREGGLIRIEYFFRVDPSDKPQQWQVVYRAPAAPVKLPVRFKFQDLPLP
jgi:hypothetical protein